METSWPAAYKMVRAEEGGNDDDPQDHGGRTSRGITQREYDAWRRLRGLPTRDVWTADEGEINSIYHSAGSYWHPYCPDMPAGLDIELFDMNVISGPHRGAITLQRALGVKADGRIGPITREAANNCNKLVTIKAISTQRRAFYTALHQPRFLRGWLNRVNFCEGVAIKVLHDSQTDAPAIAAEAVTDKVEKTAALEVDGTPLPTV